MTHSTKWRFTAVLLGTLAVAPSLLAQARTYANPAADAAGTVPWAAGVSYSYDSSGNVRQIGSDTFLYDEVNRLVQANVNAVPRDYAYDAFGNRTKCTQPGGDCQYGLTPRRADNRLAGVGYDASGNVNSFAGHTYAYDDFNMMTRDAAGAVKEFIYTASDERLATAGAQWHWTVRDTEGKILREFTSADGPDGRGTASWSWEHDYVWRDAQLLASRQPVGGAVTTYHYHLDHLGSPRRITTQNDQVAGIHDYHAFGPELAGGVAELAATSLKYTGQERDTSLSESLDTLDYMHARYYGAAIARFLTVDPGPYVLAQPQSWNRYSYVENNPMGTTDPTGKCGEPVDFIGPTQPCDWGIKETIEVTAKMPPVRNLKGSVFSAIDLILWISGDLPRVSAADPHSAEELANTPTMDQIRKKYKDENCHDKRYYGDYQYSQLTSTTSVTGQLVGSFGADIRSIGNGQIVVKAFNTWGLESATRFPGTTNRHNASIQQMLLNGAAPQYPKSILENKTGGAFGTATLNYIWIEGSPCAQ